MARTVELLPGLGRVLHLRLDAGDRLRVAEDAHQQVAAAQVVDVHRQRCARREEARTARHHARHRRLVALQFPRL